MIYYILVAAFVANYPIDGPRIEIEMETATYSDCTHAAKLFYYGNMRDQSDAPFPGREGKNIELPGGIYFHWYCKGQIREATR